MIDIDNVFFSEKMGNGNGRYNYKDLNKNELLNRLVR